MKDLEFTGSEEKISVSDYNQFIKEFSLKLPELYKQIMVKSSNGGYPKFSTYIDSDDNSTIINSWNRISLEDDNIIDLISQDPKVYSSRTAIQNHQVSENIIPKNLYPFALDGAGNDFCIDMEDNFKVYLFYPDGESRFLAKSFDDFVNALQETDN